MAPKVGKVATKGAKQIVEENATTMIFYRNMIFGAFGIYFTLKTIISDGYSISDIVFCLFGLAITLGCFQFLNFMATPKLGEGNQILDSGVDLNMESGVAEYVKDILILTCACQLLSFISKYFWLLWLLVPLVGFWFAWKSFISPWLFAPAPEMTPQEEKKQKKMDRRMRR